MQLIALTTRYDGKKVLVHPDEIRQVNLNYAGPEDGYYSTISMTEQDDLRVIETPEQIQVLFADATRSDLLALESSLSDLTSMLQEIRNEIRNAARGR